MALIGYEALIGDTLGATENNATLVATDSPDVVAFNALNTNVLQTATLGVTEPPDVVLLNCGAEVVQPPTPIGGWAGAPRDYVPRKRPPNELIIEATEPPDVCRMLVSVDWADEDDDILLMAMTEAAA